MCTGSHWLYALKVDKGEMGVNDETRRSQKWVLLAIICAVVVAIAAIFFLMEFENQPKRTFSTSANLPLDTVDPKEMWMDRVQSENEVVHGKVSYIQDLVVGRVKDEEVRHNETQNEISLLRNEIESLRMELKKNQTAIASSDAIKDTLQAEIKTVSENYHKEGWDPFLHHAEPLQANQEMFMPLANVTCQEPSSLHHIDRTIPAGTSVKAILVSSVDMTCGVKGSTDPLPVKLRIIADGRLPKEVRAKLKGGIITASVYGDLSSERVYFRLEKLTQVRMDGCFIETQVAGYVSGEDGKYGLRGTVVDKSCQLIENALITGFLAGAGDFFEAAALAKLSPAGPLGCVAGNGQVGAGWGKTAGQIAIAGGSEGVTNAMDALTDYFIERAEQLRPVIQITSGRIVDITFLDSADLGDLHTHEKVRNGGKREECAY